MVPKLVIVVTGLESAGVSWFIAVSVGYLVVVLALLFAAMFGKEEGRAGPEEGLIVICQWIVFRRALFPFASAVSYSPVTYC